MCGKMFMNMKNTSLEDYKLSYLLDSLSDTAFWTLLTKQVELV